MTELKRALQKIMSLVAPAPSETNAIAPLEFDPAWRGDHWQNLLSSPMDARHYVMEDWTVPFQYEAADAPAEVGAEKKAA
ncbi:MULTISPECIES: hypothetical protein [unclassified Caballeronia]|uniref:hypothetical protein n=1 Tax=unclassified Caballeronia TaxID=2646786 RepID=UPI003857950F